MTEDEFIQELKVAFKEKDATRMQPLHNMPVAIRIAVQHLPPFEYFCPITFVYWARTGKIRPLNRTKEVAQLLGMSEPTRTRIVDASDYYGKHKPVLRNALEDACGGNF